jgi:hypothetical protein
MIRSASMVPVTASPYFTSESLTLCPPSKDVKWRFFWRIGERPAETAFEELNAQEAHSLWRLFVLKP